VLEECDLPVRKALTSRDEAGFSMIEIMVVVLILGVVLTALFGVLDSMTRNDRRQQALQTNQEGARFAMVQMGQDLRAANPVEPLSTAAAYATEFEAAVLNAAGTSTTYVRWQLSGTTLSRSVLSAPGGTAVSTKTMLSNVENTSQGVTLFRWYDSSGTELTGTDNSPSDFSNCTVRVHISIVAASDPGPLPFSENSDAEVRNRLPGGIGC
jgi:prepilin-type N-terminal cleavage/methylation domain-containing protein